MKALKERSEKILNAVIHDYITTAEPVGSKTVAQKYDIDLSPATIRNVMSELETCGYLVHPHTSAGRVPTDKAYRQYVDFIMEESGNNIKSRKDSNIYDELKEYVRPANVNELMKETSHYLSRLSNNIGIALSPSLSITELRHIEFIRLSKKRILVIFITKSGLVYNKLVRTEEAFSQNLLDKITNYVNEEFIDMTLLQIKTKLKKLMKEDKVKYNKLLNKAMTLSRIAFSFKDDGEIYYDGTSNILTQPDFSSTEEMKRIINAFEEKNILLRLIEKCTSSNKDMQVLIGAETKIKEMEGLSVITSKYKRKGKVQGTIGVIGPTRMDYVQTILLVAYTAEQVSKMLQEV